MASLATVADLEARLGRTFDATETTRASALLDDASAVVRSYTGQQFTTATADSVRVRVRNGAVRLPQRPVSGVSAVADTDANALDFTYYGGDRVEGLSIAEGSWVDVTYDHGYAAVPDDVIAVVCQIAGRAFGQTAEGAGVTQEIAGPFSRSYGAAGAAGPAGMMDDERAVLDRYRRVGGTLIVGY